MYLNKFGIQAIAELGKLYIILVDSQWRDLINCYNMHVYARLIKAN